MSTNESDCQWSDQADADRITELDELQYEIEGIARGMAIISDGIDLSDKDVAKQVNALHALDTLTGLMLRQLSRLRAEIKRKTAGAQP
jgi:hypothetical protein